MTMTNEAFSADEITAYREGNGLWTVELIGTANSKSATITLRGVDIELVSEIGQPIKLIGVVHETRSGGTSF